MADAQQGRPGQYPTYTVGGQPFSRVNPDVSPVGEQVGTWLLSQGVRLGALLMPGDARAQTYKQAVVDRRTQPFTEKDYTQDDMAALARALVRSRERGGNSLQFQDYVMQDGEPGKTYLFGVPWAKEQVDGPWGQVVGRANYTADPQGNVTVRDTYDFNNYETAGGGAEYHENYSPEAWLGRRALPSGVRGVSMGLRVSAGDLSRARMSLGLPPPRAR